MFLISLLLSGAIHRLATHSLIEVDLMTVKLGTIDAGEESLTSNAHAARTTHTRAVNHKGIERDGCGELILGGGEADKFHHNHRADGDALIVVLALGGDELINLARDHTLETLATVVGSDVEVGGYASHLGGIDEH